MDPTAGEPAALHGGSALPSFVLNDGNSLPAVGLGTFPMHGEPGIATLLMAVDAGYRLFDTAVANGTEREVGQAVRRSGIARDEFRISTKIPGRSHGYDAARRSIDESRRTLGGRADLFTCLEWNRPLRAEIPELLQSQLIAHGTAT